jgi:hypothetical protein
MTARPVLNLNPATPDAKAFRRRRGFLRSFESDVE